MFNFRLQSILDIREIQEDKSLLDFSEQQKALQKEKEELHNIQQQKMKILDNLRDIQGKTVNVSEIMLQSDGMALYQKYEDIQTERVVEAVKKTDEKKDELLEASKKRKTMEILKSKMFKKYQSESEAKERGLIDEMAILRHKRREQE